MHRWSIQVGLAAACAFLLAVPVAGQTTPAPEKVTFDEAVRRALEKNPDVAEAAQAILRAETLLQRAQTVFFPTFDASVTTTVIDAERGFDEFVTQPQVQSLVGGAVCTRTRGIALGRAGPGPGSNTRCQAWRR